MPMYAEPGETSVYRLLQILVFSAIAGCTAGSGRGLDANGRPIGETPDPGNEPTLANIQARVFTPICVQCHVGAAAPRGLRLDSANAYNDLVNVSSQEVGNLLRVEPFNPDDSYLVRKIEGTASVGGQMPLGGPPLPAEDIQLIRDWILGGAAETSASASAAATVAAVTVRGDTVLLAFTRRLDPGSVNPGAITVTSDGGVPYTGFDAALSATRPNVVVMQLAPGRPVTDYLISVNEGNVLKLLDESGVPADSYRLEVR